MMEDPVDSVDTLEERLLQGCFRDALASANYRLRSLPVKSEALLPVSYYDIHSFSLWCKSFQLKIHFETTESDRIGAVALQSWYELWKQEQELSLQPNTLQTKVTNEESRRHLLPFLEFQCLNNNSMSMELAWILINLLWKIHERSTSMLLAVQLWKFALKSDHNGAGVCQLVSEQGILFFICEALIHVRLAANNPFWDSWYKAGEWSNLQTKCKVLSYYPTKDAVDSLIKSLSKFADHLSLPIAVSEEIKNRLETSSRKIEMQPQISQSSLNVSDPSLNARPGRPVPELLRRLRYQIMAWIRTWVLTGTSEDADCSVSSPRDRAVAVVIFVVSAWMTRRNSRKILQLLKRVIRLAILPAQELLEAFIPRQISNDA